MRNLRNSPEVTELPEAIFLVKDYDELKDNIISAVEYYSFDNKLNNPIPNMSNFTEVWQCWFSTGLNHLIVYGDDRYTEPQPHFVYFLMWAHIIEDDEDLADDCSDKSLTRELFIDLTARFAKHMFNLDDSMIDIMKI